MILAGKTKKGRERIKRDGANGWRVKRIVDKVQFSDRSGPWLWVENDSPNSLRWIHATHDEHFGIVG